MARKRTLDRKALRTDFEEAEERQAEDEEERDDEDEEEEGDEEADSESEEGGDEESDGDDEDAPKVKKKAKKPAKPVKAKSRSRAAKVVRLKATWGVFNNSNQQVESFEFSEKAEAEAHAAKLMADKKQTHFVQSVKKPFEEKEK
jgi:predicted DNA-binding WGR domain protein